MLAERFHNLQITWRRTLVSFNWCLLFFGTLTGLLIIFLHCEEYRRGYPSQGAYFEELLNNSTLKAPFDSSTVLSQWTDDYAKLLGTPDIYGAEIFGPFLGMCLPALMDLLVELYVTLTTRRTTKKHANNNAFHVVRLSILERFVFIIGVMGNAFFIVIPNDWNMMVIFTVRIVTTIMANILVNAPIIIFLERSTNVFSPFFASFILLLLVLGNLCGMYSYAIPHGTVSQQALQSCYNKISIICYVLILASCLWSFSKFLYRQHTKIASIGTNNEQHDPFLDFSTTNVPACHMVALCISVAITLGFNFGTPSPSIYYLLCTLLMMAAALVFTIEMRVRQNEIASGLHQLAKQQYETKLAEAEATSRAHIANDSSLQVLLEAKKSYVRYISHELRTPLNAATLGLNMVVTQLKKNRHPTPDEAEMCETLSDIRLACSTAVDILNDLLSFEKLESGILVLHRENISAMKFIKEGIVMFSAQAKEKQVTLDLVSIIDEETLKKYPYAQPLRINDEFSCDRFKMDQVLRNLVSNAIKFSPEGGKVTLRVFFDNTPPEFENNATSEESKRQPPDMKIPQDTMRDSSQYKKSGREDIESLLTASTLNIKGDIRMGQLAIVVTDSGPGISEANQRKLFKSVIQFDPEKNQGGGGSGFGLFISKGIVDLHYGQISVFSAGEGHGCSFILTMPMARADIDSAPIVTASPITEVTLRPVRPIRQSIDVITFGNSQRIAPAPGILPIDTVVSPAADMSMPLALSKSDSQFGNRRSSMGADGNLFRKKYRLLIVDDSALSRKMLCKTMRVAGHECDEAGDGLIALNKVKEKLSMEEMYDAILMDTNMPNMDGPSAAKAMRDLGVTIPIFGVTGNAEDKDIEYYVSQGATAVLVKPFDMSHFTRYMKEIEFSRSPA